MTIDSLLTTMVVFNRIEDSVTFVLGEGQETQVRSYMLSSFNDIRVAVLKRKYAIVELNRISERPIFFKAKPEDAVALDLWFHFKLP